MSTLQTGQPAPDFTCATDRGGEMTLSDLHGQYVVLYFYPKDDTPGCTKEACGFNDALQDFKSLNAEIVGVSKDTVSKHDKFKDKYGLNFTLISDENGDVCEKYGTWVEKNMYGRKYMGIERATFLINPDGTIAKIWRKVKVKGHVDEVQSEIENLKKAA